MPSYDFIAKDAQGHQVEGSLDATSEANAIEMLKNEGFLPTSVSAHGGAKKAPAARKNDARGKSSSSELNTASAESMRKRKSGMMTSKSMKPKEITLFTRQLAILLDAGLPLIRSLRTLERQTPSPGVKYVIGQCADTVEGGANFSEALAQHPKTFNHLFINMVRAGEAAGAMESILNRLADFMEKAARIAGKVKSAMVYPVVVLCIALIITVGLLIFVVPKFQGIFTDMLGEEAEMPWLTQKVVEFSDFLQRGMGFFSEVPVLQYVEGPVEVVTIIVVLVAIFKAIARTEKGRVALDRIKFRVPLFGTLISLNAIARFARTFGTLLGAGVPMLQALQIVKETAGNAVVQQAVQVIHDAVKDGESISKPLAGTKIFPQMVVAMVEVGEETGKLPEMLAKIADTYDEEVDNAVGALTSAIEPMMIVVLAVLVGTIVVAMFMPMIEIIKNMGSV